MIPARRIPPPLLVSLTLALIVLALIASPILASGPTGRQHYTERRTQRFPLILPLTQNHRRSPEDANMMVRMTLNSHHAPSDHPYKPMLLSHTLPLIESSSLSRNKKPRLPCLGCPGDERAKAPQHSADRVSTNIDRPGPPHPPPIIDDGSWPESDWPPIDLTQFDRSTITFPPPRDDRPEIPQGPLVPVKPIKLKRAPYHK